MLCKALFTRNLLHNSRYISDEGGFEPPIPFRYAGFQDRYFKPLRHPSTNSVLTLRIVLKLFKGVQHLDSCPVSRS